MRAAVTPINRRGRGRKWPKTKYRRQVVRRFHKKPRGTPPAGQAGRGEGEEQSRD